jgi:hypothetical protein
MTSRAGLAQCKGHGCQGKGKDSVVQGTRKGWTFGKKHWVQPECNNGIRNRDLQELLRLESKGKVNKTFRETLGLEITKRTAGSSIRIRKMSVRALWRVRSPLK